VIAAAHAAAELAARMVKIGNKNTPITEMFEKIAKDFNVNIVQGVLSHQMNRYVIDGEKVIISKSDVDHKVDEIEFAPNEVYAIDIVMSTGEGKPSEIMDRPTVYKRQSDSVYQLKMKASRAVFSDVKTKFPTFPFTLRAMDAKTARFGIKECLTHNLVAAYPVLSEKDGDLVCHVKFTMCLLASGNVNKVCGLPVVASESEFSVTDEALKALLATSVGNKKKNKKKKKKVVKTDGATEAAAE
jgi:curved DNA binding protein